ncbi:glycosyltransferase [Leclercia barmai]|uniref:glycosyltransferase n=1 Tax=Leclercia barmai TaxID=2785629 RepID=UPI003BB89C83
MPGILISVDKFDAWSPATTEIIDITDALLAKEWHVTLCTSSAGKLLQPELDRLAGDPHFQAITDASGEPGSRYDLIWIVKGFFSEKLLTALTTQRTTGAFIFRHYTDYNDVYIPWGAELENRLASEVLGLCELSHPVLVQTGIEESKLRIVPWMIPSHFAEVARATPARPLQKMLYIAETMSAEMYEVQQHAARANIQFEWLDMSQQSRRIEPDWLAGYDVVIATDQHAARALTLGIPVFLALNGYVEGYLNDDNLPRYERNAFSGASLRFCPGAEEWIELLTTGYERAAEWAQSHRQTFLNRWALDLHLSRLLTDLPELTEHRLTEKERYALSFHSKAMLAQQDRQYSIPRWLDDRKITSARREALHSFAQALPEQASIGVVVIARDEQSEACQRTLASLAAQTLAVQSLDVVPSYADVNLLLEHRDARMLLLIPEGFTLLDDALLRFMEQAINKPDASAFYCDEMTHQESSEPLVVLRPGVNIDLLRGQPYIGQVILFNREHAKEAGGIDMRYPEAAPIDLIWRLIERQGVPALAHVPEVLVENPQPATAWSEAPEVVAQCQASVLGHLARLGISASLEAGLAEHLPRLRYPLNATPLVSIVIPTRDRFALIQRCIESLMEKTRYTRYELLIVDNQSVDDDACRFLNDLAGLGLEQIRVLHYDAPFNFAEMGNAAAQQARGDVLVFLDNDCEIIDGDWLEALLEQALRPEVGVVGARLEYQDGRIQHGGYLLGVQNGVEVAFDGADPLSNGFQNYLKTPHNVAAVSGSCLTIRKETFFAINGFTQERYPIYFADVDLGLRLQQQGYINVWTPFARVKHMGGATRLLAGKYQVPERPMLEHYVQLRNEWKTGLLNDPSYHPLMQKTGSPFTLSENSARIHAPLPGRPLPVVLAHHVDWNGCGNYRIMQPFRAMESHLMMEGGLINSIPGVMEAALQQPDVIVLESLTGSRFPDIITQLRNVCDAKIIVEYDDFLLNVPLKNGNRSHYPQHIVKSFRKILESVDRVVVSTAPLAEAYSRFHQDIRIAQNRLAPDLWGHLQSQRGSGKKLRVGWAGGSTHTGDLQIIEPLIKALEHQVEWVFMGMKPRNVQCEFHPGVPFEMYPEKLASLNLDLALVPLDINQFNECKSNLRLLEIGTCGVPIIATDIAPYRCGLPVTLVENRYKDWMNAVQLHLNDAEYRTQQGDALREAVQRDWYLRDGGLDDWRHGWLDF